MSEAFESIKRGLNEALEHAAGKQVAAVVHGPKTIDVKAIRDKSDWVKRRLRRQ